MNPWEPSESGGQVPLPQRAELPRRISSLA